MKHRNPIAVVALSLITLGIYDLYWLSSVRKELNAKTSHKVPTVWLLVSPILLLIAIVILVVVASSGSNGAKTGASIISVLLGLVAVVAFMVVPMVWFYKFSKAVNEYTSGKMTTAVTFLILWLLHLIGVALVQDAFNDMPSGPQPAAAVPMQSSPGQPYYPSLPQQPPMTASDNPPAASFQPTAPTPQPQPPADGQTMPPTTPTAG